METGKTNRPMVIPEIRAETAQIIIRAAEAAMIPALAGPQVLPNPKEVKMAVAAARQTAIITTARTIQERSQTFPPMLHTAPGQSRMVPGHLRIRRVSSIEAAGQLCTIHMLM